MYDVHTLEAVRDFYISRETLAMVAGAGFRLAGLGRMGCIPVARSDYEGEANTLAQLIELYEKVMVHLVAVCVGTVELFESEELVCH